MTDACNTFLEQLRGTLGDAPLPAVEALGTGALPSIYAVTDLAAASVGSALAEIAALAAEGTGRALPATVQVDRRLASCWFQHTIEPVGWQLPPIWDDLAGDYEGADGWVRLHTNAPHHRAAALRVLACEGTRSAAAREVAKRPVDALEAELVAEGGCAAVMRSPQAWAAHPNGAAVAREPLIELTSTNAAPATTWAPTLDRPLAGLRVLDLTRVLAGPVCTRFLAGWGATVLRLDPLAWEEGALIPEVALGKRCARIDLRTPPGQNTFERLLAQADVLVHGYRPDALERLGLGTATRQSLRPGLIDVSLDAYGWTGPWATRRGFDSLVQMSCGIAYAGMQAAGRKRPFPLPVQALDHATGYLMATAVVRGLRTRLVRGTGLRARCSLARTAHLLMHGPEGSLEDSLAERRDADWLESHEQTSWGPARRLRPPGRIDTRAMSWDLPAGGLGRHSAAW